MAKAPHPLEVIVQPLITEKATRLGSESKYAFEVLLHVNKVQIREAVEKAFDVRVAAVNVMVMKGKPRRSRGGRITHRPNWKKAVVTLAAGHKLELFEGI